MLGETVCERAWQFITHNSVHLIMVAALPAPSLRTAGSLPTGPGSLGTNKEVNSSLQPVCLYPLYSSDHLLFLLIHQPSPEVARSLRFAHTSTHTQPNTCAQIPVWAAVDTHVSPHTAE